MNARRLVAACLLLTAAGGVALAGGPHAVNGAGQPMVWSTAGPVTYNPDSGPLGQLTNVQARALLAQAFAEWQAGPATITFSEGSLLAVDVNASGIPLTNPAHYQNFWRKSGDGLAPVIFDTDGSIIDGIFGTGARFDILGVAGLDTPVGAATTITEASIVINGAFFDGLGPPSSPPDISLTALRAAMVHEIGHFINLDHSVLNGELATDGNAGNDIYVPTMFPLTVDDEEALASTNPDDQLAAENLYPPGAPVNGFTGIVTTAGAVPFQGAHVVFRKTDDPLMTAYSIVSGGRFFPCNAGSSCNPCATACDPGNPALQGSFAADFFTPGTYKVCIEQIDRRFTAQSGAFVGPLATPALLPGPEECYDAAESGSSADDPDDFTAVAAGSGSPVNVVLDALPAADGFEPNNTFGTASVLADLPAGSDTAPAVLGVGDLDVYQVPVVAGQRIRIDIDAKEFGSGLDAVLGFYNASNVLVATVDDAVDPDTGEFSLDPAIELIAGFTGTAKVVISSYPDLDQDGVGGATSGPYWIRVSVATDTDGDGAPDGEDICPASAKDDADRDGACFGADNCPTVANPSQDVPYKVNAPLVAGGDVSFFAIAPGDARIVYVADQQTDDVFELYSVPTGGGTPVKLNPAFTGGPVKDVTDFRISPDGSTVVYLADQNNDEVYELFSVPIGGGASTQLNAALVSGGDVLEFNISPDGARVVYRADQTVDDVDELWSVPIGGGTVTRLNDTFVAGGSMVDPGPGFSSFLFSADGSTVVYAADQETLGKIEVYRVAVTGGGTTKLNPALIAAGDVGNFQVDEINARVLFTADAAVDQRFELYTVPLSGGAATKISGTMPGGAAGIANFRITSDGAAAVYRADQDTAGKIELYSVPAAGGAIVKLNGPLVTGGNVTRFQLPVGVGDGNRLVYRADQVTDEVFELFSAPIAGGSVVKLSPTPVSGGDVGAVGDIYASTAIYAGDIETDAKSEVYTVSVNGGPVTKLSGTMVTGGNFSTLSYTPTKVAIRMDKDTDDVFELYGTQLQGGQPFKLNAPLVSGGDVGSFGFTESVSPGTIVYMADQDVDEQFELYARPFRIDRDADGVLDDCDLCPLVADASQSDADANGVGDACQGCPVGTDLDADGICGAADNCPAVANAGQADFDGDGAGDACDNDDDNDGLSDVAEAALGTNPLDADSDNDGVSDGAEVLAGTNPNAAGSVSPGVPFREHTITATADGVGWVVAADIDGDGDEDLVSTSVNGSTIAWYENDGASPPVDWTAHTISTLQGPVRASAADIDGDGDIDVLVGGGQFGQTIEWYENDGASPPSWTVRNILTSGGIYGVLQLFAADVDGDGDEDVVSNSGVEHKVEWFDNDGAVPPSWTRRTIFVYDPSENATVFVADVDGDRDPDVVVASVLNDTLTWYENDGSVPPLWTVHTIATTSADQITSVFAADLDGDGDVDVLAGAPEFNRITWYENDGAVPPSWTVHTISTAATWATDVSAADMDGDGDLDVLAALATTETVAWYENDGATPPAWTAHTISSVAYPSAVIAADVDRDGDMDVLSAHTSQNTIAWYENQTIHRNASFSVRHTVSGAVAGAVAVDAGDIDGDGDIDTMHADGQGNVIKWFESSGANPPVWTSHTVGATSADLQDAKLCDLDGDGDLDVLFATGVTVDSIGWFENGGGALPSWTLHTISTSQATPLFVIAADIDGDGDLDVVASSQADSTLAWYRNDGGAPPAFTKLVISSTPQYERGLAAADMDRDGDIDIVAAVPNLGRVVWFENGGGPTPTWTEAVVSVPDIGLTSFVDVADINGDGDPDVVAASYNGFDIAWFESDGAADPHWTTHSIVTPFIHWAPLYAKDMDRDGDIDIVASAGADGFVWLDNDGNDPPGWTLRAIPTSGDSVGAFTPADLDRDGDLDLVIGVFTSGAGHEHEWWENRGGQYSLTTTSLAPTTARNGATVPMLAIDMASNGRAGDSGVELAALGLRVTDSGGISLSTEEANRLIARLRIYLDNGSSVFEPGSDTLVTTVEDLALAPLVIPFTKGDPRVRVAAGQTKRLFVVVDTTLDASSQTPNAFRLALDAASGTEARAAATGSLLTLQLAAAVTTTALTSIGDLVAPFVTSVYPADGSVDVAANTDVVLFMSEPVNPATAAAGVSLALAGAKVSAAVRVSTDGRMVTVDPGASLPLGATFQLKVTSALKDRSGNGAASFTSSFESASSAGSGTIDAGTLGAASGGSLLEGANANDNSGFSAAALEDVNAPAVSQGIGDLIVGAPNADAGAVDAGEAKLVFGSPGLQSNGGTVVSVTYRTGVAGDFLGESVAPAGDMNHDGIKDFLIGAPRSDQFATDAGVVYLVFGDSGIDELAPGPLNLSNLAACASPTLCGVKFLGAGSGDMAGASISPAGDVNADGFDDILIGAPHADPAGRADAGVVYLIFGPLAPGTIALGAVGTTTRGLVLRGESAGDELGSAVSQWKDRNGDGIDDVLLGAPLATTRDQFGATIATAGCVYAVQGGTRPGHLDDTASPGVIELSRVANGAADQVAGMVFLGATPDGALGRSLTGGVDTDGNGVDDILIAGNGVVFVIPGDGPKTVDGGTRTGPKEVAPTALSRTFGVLDAIEDFGAVRFAAENSDPLTVGDAGDLNHDGFDDFIVGSPLSDGPAGIDSGRAYVVLGSPAQGQAERLLADVGGSIAGFVIQGAEAGDNLGASVGGGQDLNADGVDDGLVGAPFADTGAGAPVNAGATYVISPLHPDEVQQLKVSRGSPTLEWSVTDLAATYDVYRGSLLTVRSSGGVRTSQMTALGCGVHADADGDQLPDLNDATAPPGGDGFVYLVTARNVHGEGSLGPGTPTRVNDAQCP